MQENTETPVKSSKRSQILKSKRLWEIGFSVILIAVIGLGAWSLYSIGYKNGKTKAENSTTSSAKQTASVPKSLTALPASGEVSAITDKEITLKVGSDTKKASIDSKTVITKKADTAKAGDIKTGSRVILFTKKVGSAEVATRIIAQ